ncbi:MAG: hypothetical protein M3Z64_00395 [Verrucomicrobiota bacterium]|nr:hypothetical protein [Verrucomicrobiota bacterium]
MKPIGINNESARRIYLAVFAICTSLTFAASAFGAKPATGTLSATSPNPVTWVGDAPGVPPAVGAAQEATCVDGGNCDVFTITLSGVPADYVGKQVTVTINWGLPTTDYDLYIHKDTLAGALVASGRNGGPSDPDPTTDSATFNPATSGTGKYVVHVLYAATPGPGDQYSGIAKVAVAGAAGGASPPPVRTATYTSGAITFSPNVAVKAPVTNRDGEPSSRTDFMGNTYVGGIRGVPAGVDLWYFNTNATKPNYDPFMRVPNYRGQPDAFSPSTSLADLGADGGGDIDLAVGFALPAGQADPTLAFSSLVAANISVGISTDRAQTYMKNPAGNVTGGVGADDREWNEFLGASSVYLLYRTLEPAVTQIQRSDDGGFTYGAASTAGAIGQTGPVDVFQKDGTVYAPGSTGAIAVGMPTTPKGTPLSTDYVVRQAATDPNGVAHLFFVTKIADDGTTNGTLYACYSNDTDILLKSSKDKGVTWTNPVKVNNPAGPTKVNFFPWMETGPTPGSVGIVWYGTSSATNNDNAEFKVYFAQSFNADTATPEFRIAEVTEPEHVIHAANVSEGGTLGNANRNLLDYFQVSFDPQGAAVIAYTDDHNDFDGNTYVAHQIAGPSILGGNLAAPNEGAALTLPPATASVDAADVFPPRQPGFNGEQVTAYPFDVQDGLLARVRVADPFDITAIRYDTSGTGAKLAIAATMRVSDLSTIPPSGTWQMNFAVNSPHSQLSATGAYTYGASDHGDQFYVEADTDASGAPTFTYGKAVRASTGTITYTQLGTADAGEFNSADNTISVQVSVAKLNAALAAGRPAISNGTVVTGLRGRAITAANPGTTRAHNDSTRGGTQFVVHDSAQPQPASTPLPTPLPVAAAGSSPSPTPPRTQLGNIASRLQVLNGDQDGIAGVITRGAVPKRALIRAIGPSINVNGTPVAGTITDPSLVVFDSTGKEVARNDNWRGDVGGTSQQSEITASGLAPVDDREAAVIVNLSGNSLYTAVASSKSGAAGIGLIEVYDLESGAGTDFFDISTRAQVGTGDAVLIGGFIIKPSDTGAPNQKIVVRGIIPKINGNNVPNALSDPVVSLYDGNGTLLETNDNFADSPEAAEITANKLAPTDPKESAILKVLPPGLYTAVVGGANNSSGLGLVEVYNLGAP